MSTPTAPATLADVYAQALTDGTLSTIGQVEDEVAKLTKLLRDEQASAQPRKGHVDAYAQARSVLVQVLNAQR